MIRGRYIPRAQALPVGTRVRILAAAVAHLERYVGTEATIIHLGGTAISTYYEIKYFDGRTDAVYATWVEALQGDTVEVEE